MVFVKKLALASICLVISACPQAGNRPGGSKAIDDRHPLERVEIKPISFANAVLGLASTPRRVIVVGDNMGASFSVDDRSDYSDLLHLEGDRLVEAAFCGHGGLFAVGTRKPDGHGQIVQPSSHRADGTLRKQIAGQPSDLLCIDGEIWISEIDGSSIQRFDTPGLRELSAVEGVGSGVIAMAEDWDAVYALSSGRHASATWTRIALESREVGPRVPAGRCPSDIAVGAGYIWVTSLCAKELLRFDPAGRLRGSLPLPSGPTTVHSHFGLLWVGTRTEMLYIDPERLSIIGSKNMRGKVRAMIVGGERLWTLFGYSRLRKLPLEVPE